MNKDKTLLLSINQAYTRLIFQRTKTVELRKVYPKYSKKGNLAIIYTTSPVSSITGAFQINNIIEEPLNNLWEKVGNKAGVTREEFDTYYRKSSTGVAILFKQVWQLPKYIPLSILKKESFCVPQGFRYATKNEVALFKKWKFAQLQFEFDYEK